jgi:hypothetical protein
MNLYGDLKIVIRRDPYGYPRANVMLQIREKTGTRLELERYEFKDGQVVYIRIHGEDPNVSPN